MPSGTQSWNCSSKVHFLKTHQDSSYTEQLGEHGSDAGRSLAPHVAQCMASPVACLGTLTPQRCAGSARPWASRTHRRVCAGEREVSWGDLERSPGVQTSSGSLSLHGVFDLPWAPHILFPISAPDHFLESTFFNPYLKYTDLSLWALFKRRYQKLI